MEKFIDFFKKRNISLATARMWRHNYGLPVIQIGKALYVSEDDFTGWIDRHKTRTCHKDTSFDIAQNLPQSRIRNKMKRIN